MTMESTLPRAPDGLLGPPESHPATVRLRSACEECRAAKAKCCRKVPCDRCARLKRPCVYKPALTAGRKPGQPKPPPVPAASRYEIVHPPRPSPPDPSFPRTPIAELTPPILAQTIGQLAHELEIHHAHELDQHHARSPDLRSPHDFVVSSVEPGSAWQALSVALVTAATTDQPIPLAPLFRVARDPYTAVERPAISAPLPPLPPLPHLTEDDVIAVFSQWAITCPNSVIVSPHLFASDLQSGQLDRSLVWMIAARVLDVKRGMAESAREAGLPAADLPDMPCDWTLLVAHAERDLHARSIDDRTVSTISALVLLAAVDMFGLRQRPSYGYGLAAAAMTLARRQIARRLADGWTRSHLPASSRVDIEMEMLINAAWMLSFLLAWHALDGRASAFLDHTSPISGLPLPAYATQLGPLERTIGGAAIARRHRDFCDACRVLQIIAQHDGDSRCLATPRFRDPSSTSVFGLLADPRAHRLRPTAAMLPALLHSAAVKCIAADAAPAQSAFIPIILTVYGLARHNAHGYLLEAASLGIELVETLVVACEIAKRPGVVDRHTVQALFELLQSILPRAFDILSEADESAADGLSVERIDRATTSLLYLRDELDSPSATQRVDTAHADRLGDEHAAVMPARASA